MRLNAPIWLCKVSGGYKSHPGLRDALVNLTQHAAPSQSRELIHGNGIERSRQFEPVINGEVATGNRVDDGITSVLWGPRKSQWSDLLCYFLTFVWKFPPLRGAAIVCAYPNSRK